MIKRETQVDQHREDRERECAWVTHGVVLDEDNTLAGLHSWRQLVPDYALFRRNPHMATREPILQTVPVFASPPNERYVVGTGSLSRLEIFDRKPTPDNRGGSLGYLIFLPNYECTQHLIFPLCAIQTSCLILA
ncbi:MAG: hypothetical protein Q8O97_00505 [bacterium]|nr:hypothetical protein [bacterium]